MRYAETYVNYRRTVGKEDFCTEPTYSTWQQFGHTICGLMPCRLAHVSGGAEAAATLQKPTIVNTAVRLKSRSKGFDEVNLKVRAGLQY